MLISSSELEKWANTIKSNGLSPQEEFKKFYSVKRLRSTDIYEDTIKVLYEIAEKDCKGECFN